MMSVILMDMLLSLAGRQRLLQLFQRALRRHDVTRIGHLTRREASALHELDAGNIPNRERELVVDGHIDQHRLAGDAEPREELRRRPRWRGSSSGASRAAPRRSRG